MSDCRQYILVDGKPVPEPDILAWSKWFQNIDNRQVAYTGLPGGVRVSTDFIGFDQSFGFNKGTPLLFETLVFGGPHDQKMERYATIEEALAGHEWMVKLISAKE